MATETPLANSPEVRTPDGTIKDQGVSTSTQTEPSSTPQQTTPPAGTPTTPPETPAKQPTEGKTSLTDPGATPAGAPETYADFKAPDGFEINKEALDLAVPMFKELNLNQDQAQKLIDFYAKTSAEAANAPLKFYQDMQVDWQKQSAERFGKAIEPGGEIVTEFAKAIDGHLPPSLAKSFRAALDFTGVGNHPDFIEGFRQFAKLLGEGTSVRGTNPSPLGQKAPDAAPKSLAQAMYPNLPSASGS